MKLKPRWPVFSARRKGTSILASLAWVILILSAGSAAAQEKPEIFAQLGAGGPVLTVAFSPDGRTALSGGEDSALQLWDVATGRELRTFVGHTSVIESVAFSPDGRTALSASDDNTLKLWDIATGRELRTFKAGDFFHVHSVRFSPDGRTALSAQDNSLKLWDVTSGRKLLTLDDDLVQCVAFSPNGHTALSGNGSGQVELWDLSTGRPLRTFLSERNKGDMITSVAFSPDGRTALTGRFRGLDLWDVATGRKIRTLDSSEWFSSVAFSPDGRTALSGDMYATLKLWDVATGHLLLTLRGHTHDVNSVAFSPDGRTALSGSSDSTLRLWDLGAGREVRAFSGSAGKNVRSMSVAPDGREVLSGSDDNTVKLWDLTSGRELRRFSGHTKSVLSVAFSPDARTALSGSMDHTMKLWDVTTGRELRTFSGHTDESVGSVAFSPDGRAALSGSSDCKVQGWDLATGQQLRELSSGKFCQLFGSLAFSPDGHSALIFDVTLPVLADTKLWDLVAGREIRTFPHDTHAAAFSPDGSRVLLGGASPLGLWDMATGRELRRFSGDLGLVNSVAFSPDGTTALSGDEDKFVKLWDVATGRELSTFSGPSAVRSVAFSPDGRSILSAGTDGAIRVWSLSSGKELLQLISFTDGEWVAITPDGYYNASPKGDQYINVRIGTNVYGVDQWRSKFYRPDVVEAVLHLGDTGAALSATLGTTGPAPMIEPPFVAIKSPDDGAKLNSLSTEIALIVEDRHLAIRSVKVLVNGRTAAATGERRISPLGPALDFPAGQKQLLLHVPVTLDPGENRIEVAASNGVSEGRQTLRILAGQSVSAADQADILPNLWILGIAVNRYDSRDIQSLSYAVADVHGIAAAFTAQKGRLFREVHTLILADDGDLKPTRDNIIDNLRFLKKAGQNDVALLIISGHGENDDSGNYFFLPSDAALQEDRLSIRPSHAVSWRDLKSVLEVPAKKIVLLDTCHAEGISGKSAEKRRGVQTTDTNRLVKELQDFGAVVFASSRGAESSVESDKWGHGAFTYALLKGLNGEANLMHRDVITMKELDAYVSETVPTLTGGTQHPITYTPDGYVDFPVAKLK